MAFISKILFHVLRNEFLQLLDWVGMRLSTLLNQSNGSISLILQEHKKEYIIAAYREPSLELANIFLS